MMKIEDVGLQFKQPLTPIKSVNKIVVHHPASSSWTIQDIHRYHQQTKGWNGIGYNYFVTKDGRVQKGRGMNVGAHVSGHNSNTLGVSFQGNFETETPTNVQLRAGAQLIAQLLLDTGLNIHDVIGHKNLAITACPGKNFDLDQLRSFILEYINPKAKVDPAPKRQVKSEVVTNKGGNTVVQKGDRGKIVGTIQKLVGGIRVDDDFGPITGRAVGKFQESKGLTVDEIVGPITWRYLTGDKGGLLH